MATKTHRTVQTRLIRIGNSRGLRLPKALIDQAGLVDKVQMEVANGGLLIRPAREPRAGWEAECRLLVARGEGTMLDQPTATAFDNEEWEW